MYVFLFRNVFPDNLIVACFNAYRSKEIPDNSPQNTNITTTLSPTVASELSNKTGTPIYINDLEDQVRNEACKNLKVKSLEIYVDGSAVVSESPKTKFINEGTGKPNVLGIVMFSICFGVMLGRMGERGQPIVAFCDCLVEVTMKLFSMFLWYSPIGISFLIAAKIVDMEDFSVLLGKVGMYFITVLIGLFVHGSVVLPFLYFIAVRKNPYRFIYGISQAMATAFGTSSSSATMPVTLRCLEHNNRVDARVASFVIPVGATINMDGTALYEAVAALFIAQVNNQNMNFSQIITISITATAASVGAAGVPQAGLVTMVIVLAAVGLPIDDVTLILVVDWFLDRFRTMTNVMGDSLGAGIVHHYSVDEMPPLDHDMHDFDGDRIPNGQQPQQDTTPV
ncbi:amino acid transporter [Plakobranchus ocellatus]|uniref:Amino acid transporter n=1 Tax=Plakobranchus ocellatus TaxID=259542 RepID=A0AAV4BZS3_9GAST|nr:amino acid transporter [Plakobranchus ocellatus]